MGGALSALGARLRLQLGDQTRSLRNIFLSELVEGRDDGIILVGVVRINSSYGRDGGGGRTEDMTS